jgi:DNA-binding NtrC family response regulator
MAVRQAAGMASSRAISAVKTLEEKSSPLDLRETEKKLIMQALATTNGNVTAAAKQLGISRRTLHRKINEMNAATAQPDAVSEHAASPENAG